MAKRWFRSGSSTRMSFWATRKMGWLEDMDSSMAFTEASRPTSKWTIIFGYTVRPRRARAGMVCIGTVSVFSSSGKPIHFLSTKTGTWIPAQPRWSRRKGRRSFPLRPVSCMELDCLALRLYRPGGPGRRSGPGGPQRPSGGEAAGWGRGSAAVPPRPGRFRG